MTPLPIRPRGAPSHRPITEVNYKLCHKSHFLRLYLVRMWHPALCFKVMSPGFVSTACRVPSAPFRQRAVSLKPVRRPLRKQAEGPATLSSGRLPPSRCHGVRSIVCQPLCQVAMAGLICRIKCLAALYRCWWQTPNIPLWSMKQLAIRGSRRPR